MSYPLTAKMHLMSPQTGRGEMHECSYAEYNDGHVDCGSWFTLVGSKKQETFLCQLCSKDAQLAERTAEVEKFSLWLDKANIELTRLRADRDRLDWWRQQVKDGDEDFSIFFDDGQWHVQTNDHTWSDNSFDEVKDAAIQGGGERA